jgi:hypothetical protein
MYKRKKHSTDKRAKRLMGNIRLWSWESEREDDSRILYGEVKRSICWVNLDPTAILVSANKLNNWTLIVRAILWYPDGKADIKSAIGNFPNITLAKLEEEAKLLRKTALEGIQKGHIVDVGWIALSYVKAPRINEEVDMLHLGSINEHRQMLWNYAITEELKET